MKKQFQSMIEVLVQHAQTQPDKLCIADDRGARYTYKEALQTVYSIGNTLTAEGILPGQAIAVECGQRAAFFLIDLACQLIGAIFVPVEFKAAAERIRNIVAETDCVLWIYEKVEVDYVRQISCSGLMEKAAGAEVNLPAVLSYPAGDAVSEILFTTGTTGTSKGIVITNKANVALAENIISGVHMPADNVELIPLPLSHSHGLRCAYANLLTGGTIVLADGLLKIKKVFRLMEEYGVNAIDLSPSAAQFLLKLTKGAFSEYGRHFHYIEIGTAPLPEDVKSQLLQEMPDTPMYNFYGSTESGRTCALDFNACRGKANCIGLPTKNAHIVFTDEARQIIDATPDHPGLLASSGSMNMKEYLGNPELTLETMHDGFVYSNDLGYMDEDGFVYVLGRRDDVINMNGIKIAPTEIEDVALRFEGITDCACIPKKDAMAGQVPVLFVALTDPTQSIEKLTAYLREHLDANKMPKEIRTIPEIPHTYNGKIRRKDLEELV